MFLLQEENLLINNMDKNVEICFKHFNKSLKEEKILNKDINVFKIKKTVNFEINYYNNKITI